MRCSLLSLLLVPLALAIPSLSQAASDTATPASRELNAILAELAEGKQHEAEDHVEKAIKSYPNNSELLFLNAVCLRSRFQVEEAGPLFFKVLNRSPRSPEGLAAGCILGVDFAQDRETAIHFFGALCALARRNPESFPIRWMSAVMVRALTVHAEGTPRAINSSLLGFGIAQYENLLRLISPKAGPCLVHQTFSNLLDDADYYHLAYKHRLLAIGMERRGWALDAMACTLKDLGLYEESLKFAEEAIAANPDSWDYINRKAKTLEAQGRPEDYANVLIDAEKHFPQMKELPYYCAYTLFENGDWERASNYAEKAINNGVSKKENELILARAAVRLGKPGAAEALEALENPKKPKPGNSSSPLEGWFKAAQQGDKVAFDRLVDTVDINARSREDRNCTALIMAAQAGATDILAELIKRGADLNAVDTNGDTALNFAAQFRQYRAIEMLMDAGADPSIEDKWKQTPLISCAGQSGNLQGVRVLVKKGVNLEHETPHGGTALRYAAGFGRVEIVRLLIQKGANIEAAVRNDGQTPLISTAKYVPHPAAASILLEAGAKVNALDKQGRSTLHLALRPERQLPFVEMLLAYNADPKLADRDGITAIRKARFLGWDEEASLLEKKAGAAEPFFFPSAGDAAVESNDTQAALLCLPLAFVHGHLPTKTLFGEPVKRDTARTELKEAFGIKNAADLSAFLKKDSSFEPKLIPQLAQLNTPLKAALDEVLTTDSSKSSSLSAWNHATHCYLTRLGNIAGYLKDDEATPIIAKTLEAIRTEFHSWEEYSESFLRGVSVEAGWEHERYTNICRRLLDPMAPNCPWIPAFWKS